MKIFLLSDYFYPFNPGGSEWSVFHLAKSLKSKKIEPVIITLNYGASEEELYKGITIIRIPFIKKISDSRKTVSPVWQNNPFFFISSTYHLIRLINREKPHILHSQGKFLIPATIISSFFTKIPSVVTLRDKQILCSIGKCFFTANRRKSCSFFEYLFADVPWFYRNYTKNKNSVSFLYITLGAIYNRVSFSLIKFFAKRAKALIAISKSQKDYLETNGFSKVQVIYNTASFTGPKSKVQKHKSVLFAGKLSKGKGGEVLVQSIKELVKKNKIQFIFAGTIELQKMVDENLKNKFFRAYTKFLGNLDHSELTRLYTKVSTIIMPSIYPESFGRIALEAISQGTPAIVSRTGGLREIVQDKKTGRIIKPEKDQLQKAILDIVANEKYYKQNIKKEYSKLRNKFRDIPIKDHIHLYSSLIK